MIGMMAQIVGALCLVGIVSGYAFTGSVSPWIFMIGSGVLIPAPILLDAFKERSGLNGELESIGK